MANILLGFDSVIYNSKIFDRTFVKIEKSSWLLNIASNSVNIEPMKKKLFH